jgi:hypothetical protein
MNERSRMWEGVTPTEVKALVRHAKQERPPTFPAPNLPRIVLEHWRIGAPTRARLHALAKHFAFQYPATTTTDELTTDTLALMYPGELTEEA